MGCNCSKEKITVNDKRFYIISRIADGGFGKVDLIEDSKNYKQYALKRVKCENKNELEKISLENKYYKQLNSHPNLVKLIYDDIIEDKKSNGFLVLSVFPFYQAGNLQEELERNSKTSGTFIENDRLVNIFFGICSGTNYIHESNLAHRDLKPLNVLLGNDRTTPVLTDFGSMTDRTIDVSSSRKAQELQDWAAQNCSMFYRAPELFSPKIGETISEKADVWSIGCILYALMFNKGPFDYVVEKGDSIALAVTNAKYIITPSQLSSRPEYLINLLKHTILFESSERENLPKIINDLKKFQVKL